MINKNSLFFDYKLLIAVILLSITGIVFVYSSSFSVFHDGSHLQYQKQIFFLISGFFVMWLAAFINYRKLIEHKTLIYLITIAVLLFTLLFGKVVNNSRRWVSFGLFSIQPSEFAKISWILVLAGWLEQLKDNLDYKALARIFILMLVPCALVLLQPDLGTALIFIPITLVMIFMAGVSGKYLTAICLLLFIAGFIPLFLAYTKLVHAADNRVVDIISNHLYILITAFFFLASALVIFIINFSMRNLFLENVIFFLIVTAVGLLCAVGIDIFLKPYQKERLLVFINPELKRWTSGYNIIQSVITIGSGGIFGKGITRGTQSQLGFLPEQSTDFIFSLIGEEGGFILTAGIVLVFLFLLYRIFKITASAKDYPGGFIGAGIFMLFFSHIFVNIGMVIAVAPVTGLPLPFITAGGSSQWLFMFAVGMIFNIEIRRHVHTRHE
ncbi:MAG: rod shape-determining protein RodA [Spirochaetes bacterium GWF1_41_5]|nr:MAG: rod shape-determining protein RodA [Spirochaetes bacterium GWF1_41_5]HBE02008.1 rod shape-determining protein RodA [Spirochaetia bacterium]